MPWGSVQSSANLSPSEATQKTAEFELMIMSAQEALMAAYFLLHNRIHNAEKMQEYLSKVGETLAPYHPEIIIVEEDSQVLEGNTNLPRTILMKFDSREDVIAWYNSPAYQKLLPLRLEATEGYAVLVGGRE